jgi:hypothetical protein
MLSIFRKLQPMTRCIARRPLLQNNRLFSTDAGVSKAQRELCTALEKELKEEVEDVEKESYVNSFVQDKGWAKEFGVESTRIVLSKKIGELHVKVYYQAKAPQATEANEEEAAEEEQNDNNYTEFFVLIDRNGPNKVLLDAIAMDGEVTISGILVSPQAQAIAESSDSNPYNYTGPSFESLDDNLQTKINKYVQHLGIDEELARFLEESSAHLESKLYQKFLKDLKDFVAL